MQVRRVADELGPGGGQERDEAGESDSESARPEDSGATEIDERREQAHRHRPRDREDDSRALERERRRGGGGARPEVDVASVWVDERRRDRPPDRLRQEDVSVLCPNGVPGGDGPLAH
jgi:hypothetical protein